MTENLFKRVDRRIDTSFGVSAIVKALTTQLHTCTVSAVFAENVVDHCYYAATHS